MSVDLDTLSPGNLAAGSPVCADRELPPKPRVYLHQFNQAYDDTVYIPLSIGVLKAACDADPFVRANFEFGAMTFLRDDVEPIVSRYRDPDILCFSLYVWNERLSLELAEVMEERTDCLVILGGPSVPNRSEEMLRRLPFVDYLVHGEGERTFVELLAALKKKTDLLAIPGISFLQDGKYYSTGRRERVRDLDSLPSPFLSGTFDELLDQPYKFQGIWETNRGCPWECTFCYWGSNLKAKISTFSMDRLERELAWMAANRMEFVYAADANFGILKRDLDLCDLVIRTKRENGYPKSFFINYSKNTGDRVFEIAKKFHEADLSKGTTLSLQSLDDDVLGAIKRRNIKMAVFQDLQRRYRAAGVPSYTELILPLPGESLATYVEGLEQTVEGGEHDQIYAHLCRLLPNTEMSSPEARDRFGLRTRLVPILSSHVNLGQEAIGVKEYEEIVIETEAMPVADWRTALAMSWMVVTHICLKVSYFTSLYLFHDGEVRFTEYLRAILDCVDESPERFPVLAGEQKRFYDYAASLLEADGEIDYSGLEFLEPIRWPIEEVSFIVFSRRREEVYRELLEITSEVLEARGIDVEPGLLDELFAYQKNRLIGFPLRQDRFEYSWDFASYFDHTIVNDPVALQKRPYRSELIEEHSYGSFDEFARFHVWYGRRRKQFYYPETAVYEVPQAAHVRP